jgi:hypothetical protein
MILRRVVAITSLGFLGGCAHLAPGGRTPAELQWPVTLLTAKHAAAGERYQSADQVLLEFSHRYAGTPQAHEVTYWRAMVALHSAAQRPAALDTASALLEAYMAAGPSAPQYLEAAAAKLLIEQAAAKEAELAQVRRALSQARTEVARERPAAQPGREPARQERQDQRNLAGEVEALRAELNRANQELERIRRRLAGQNP